MEHESALVLDDGTVARGRAFGAPGRVFGELVFETGMTGYQEALTDPSFNGLLLMMTYPMVGNYGISKEAFESSGIKAEALVVREHCLRPSHRASQKTVSEFLADFGIVGISGVDTRALTIRTREMGAMRAGIVPAEEAVEALQKVKSMDSPYRQNLVAQVSTAERLVHPHPSGAGAPRVVVVDCGVKRSIIRNLNAFAEVVVVPYSWTAEQVMAERPDGVMVSNGPGDPSHPEILRTAVKTVRELAGQVPIMGICFGHQLIALAFGGRTFKLKFGHRGANQPVRDELSRKVVITSQNHGFAVHPDLPSELLLLETNVNDGTVEGLRHRELPVFSVQYHPEASPGPLDAHDRFDRFREMIRDFKRGR